MGNLQSQPSFERQESVKVGSPDDAKDSIVEVMEAQSSSGEEEVESILQKLRADSRALPVTGMSQSQPHRLLRRRTWIQETHASTVLSSTFLSPSFSLAPTRLACCSRLLRSTRRYRLERMEKEIPASQN